MGILDFFARILGVDDEEDKDEEIKEKKEPKYNLKASQVSDSEKYFYDILKNNFSDKYEIRPQVPLSSIIEKEKSFSSEYQNELNRIIDFGIFDKKTLAPLLLIEINDSTHSQPKRIERDKKVKSICESAGIKIITFWTKFDNKPDYVVNRITKELSQK